MVTSTAPAAERPLHPIVARQRLAPGQLAAVLFQGGKLLVVAGAGAGKTRTLTARLLHLLAQPELWQDAADAPGADGTPLRQIAAITFTRKAAREMRTRLRALIADWLHAGEMESGERARWERVLIDLEAAPIGTIHGLCTDLLRAHPAEARLDPRFGVLEEGNAAALVEQSLDSALLWAVASPGAAPLASAMEMGELRDLGRMLVTRRLDAERALSQAAEVEMGARIEETRRRVSAFVASGTAAAALRVLASAADRAVTDAAAATDRLAPYLPVAVAAWQAALEAEAAGDWGSAWQQLALLRANLPANKGAAKVWKPLEPKAAVEELRRLFDEQLPEIAECDHAQDELLLELLPPLRDFFAEAVSVYSAAKDELRVLDFDDLEQRALALLQEHAEVRRRMQGRLLAILVDEFQDTNDRQRLLIDLLAGGPERLTFVGDPKQSIYRFRGANVAIMQRELEQAPGGGVQLATSYRAHGALVHLLNLLLEPVLSEGAGKGDSRQPPWTPLEPSGTVAPRLAGPFVELLLAQGTRAAGALDSAAELLARRLHELHSAGLAWSEMAILCRAARSFEPYEDALERAGIPYVTVAGRGFYERPEVRDLTNALRALSDPTDNLALLGLLRSPAIGLRDDFLFLLGAQALDDAHAREALVEEKGMAVGMLWERLQASTEPAAVEAVALIRKLNLRAGRSTVATLIKLLYDQTGYPAALERTGQARGARNLAKLHEDALRSGRVSVSAFLEDVVLLQRAGAREGEARADAEGVVQILTVHAAKGLEWPLVVVGDAGARGGTSAGRHLLEEGHITLNLRGEGADGKPRIGVLARAARDRATVAEAAESDRLLYVAATRAQQMLLISGTWRGKERVALEGWLKRLSLSLNLDALLNPLLAAAPDADQTQLLDAWMAAGAPNTPPERLAGELTPETAVRLVVCATSATTAGAGARAVGEAAPALASPSLAHGVEAPLVAPLPAPVDARADDEDEEVRAAAAGSENHAPGWLVHQIVHEALAAWRFPRGENDEEFAAWVESRARSLTLTERKQIEDAVARVSGQLLALLRHPLHSEIQGALDRKHDLPYHGPLSAGAAGQRGRADLLYQRPDGGWVVIDFKTESIRSPRRRREILERRGFLEQIRQDVRVLSLLLGEAIEARIVLLDDQREVSIVPLPAQP